MRTAAGAVAAAFLEALGIRVLGHVLAVGGVAVADEPGPDLEDARARRDASPLHALGEPSSIARAVAAIDAARAAGDTLGGLVQVVVDGAPWASAVTSAPRRSCRPAWPAP